MIKGFKYAAPKIVEEALLRMEWFVGKYKK
jgi:hypothetical protein